MLYLFAVPLQFYFLCLIFESICNTFVDPGFGVFFPLKWWANYSNTSHFFTHWFETACFLFIFKEHLLKCLFSFWCVNGSAPAKFMCINYKGNQWMVPLSSSGATPGECILEAAGKWKEQLGFSWIGHKHLNCEGIQEGMRNQEKRDSQSLRQEGTTSFWWSFQTLLMKALATQAPLTDTSNLWYVATKNWMRVPCSLLYSYF